MPIFGPDSPLRGPRFWITCASLAAVASLALVDVERTAPGPLAEVHALGLAVEGLTENDCAACHGGWFESMTGACFECHGGIETDIAGGRGVHGMAEVEDCATCHGEHNGPGFDLAGPRAFRLAGVLGEPWGPEAFGGLGEGLAASGGDAVEGEWGAEPSHEPFHEPLAQSVGAGSEGGGAASGQPGGATGDALGDGSGDGRDEGPGAGSGGQMGDAKGGASLGGVLQALVDASGPATGGDRRGREAVDHSRFGFDLGGAHLDLACVECHAAADTRPLPAGTPRFRGLDRACASCHTDDHAPVFPKDCTACHSQATWSERSFAPHAAWFPREGAHAEVDCRACHAEGSTHSLERHLGRRGGGLPDVRACAECHADPHARDVLAAVRALGGDGARAPRVASDAPPLDSAPVMQLGVADADSRACATCHAVTAGGFHTAGERMTPDLHAAAGFELGAAHAEVDCSACHAPSAARGWPTTFELESGQQGVREPRGSGSGGEADLAERIADFAARHPGRERSDCAACHADPHVGQFAQPGAQREALACVDCHGADGFTDQRFDAGRHADLALPLTGSHAELDCASCHGAVAGAGDAASLAVALREQLTQRAAIAALADEDFGAPAPEDLHAVLPPAGGGGALPEPPERVRVFRGTDPKCAACHGDPHAGFAFADEPGCADCHDDRAFEAAADGFDHDQATGFALAGAHGQADCASCHVPRALPSVEGRRFGTALETMAAEHPALGALVESDGHAALNTGADTACALCHADPHGGVLAAARPVVLREDGLQDLSSGQGGGRSEEEVGGLGEALEGLTDCAACHTTASFRALSAGAEAPFAHAAETGFALDGRHGDLDCAACHAVDPAGARIPVRGADCASCHAEPHAGQFEDATRGGDCVRCHTSARPFTQPTFRHDLDSDFPLDGRHAELACASCHGLETFGDAGLFRRYRPLASDCTSCHGAVEGSGVLRRTPSGGGR